MHESSTVTIGATIGIEVSKDRLDVALRREEREQPRVCANTPAGFLDLHTWLGGQDVQPPQTRVVLEATGSYSDAIALFLYEHDYLVSVLNPAVLVDSRHSVNVRSKTAALDARLLARSGQERRPRLWKPLPPEMHTLRFLLARRQDLQHMLQQERNRLHAGRMDDWIRSRVQQHVTQLDKEVRALWKRIMDHLKAHPSLKSQWRRLQTIKGIGPIGAACLLAEVGHIERFDDPRALVSLAGLAVTRHDSATSARGTPLRVVRVAAMRKLLHIGFGVWKHETDYDPTLAFPEVA